MTHTPNPCPYKPNCIAYKSDCPMCSLNLDYLRNTHCPAYISFDFLGQKSRFWKDEPKKGLLSKLVEWLR